MATAVLLLMTGPFVAPARGVLIDVGSATGSAGATVTVEARIHTMGEAVGGASNDVSFDANAPIVACRVSPAFAGVSAISFRPQGCTAGVDCESVGALILDLSLQPIPDASVLYSCDVKIAETASRQSFPLTCSSAMASSPGGQPLVAECSDGEVSVPVAGDSGGGGCQVGSPGSSRIGPVTLLIGAAVLLPLRRRVRRFAALRGMAP